MSEPFDYTELFKGAFAAMREEQPGNRIAPAAAYLRTRIEAAFVPVERYEAERIEWLQRDLVAQNKVAKYCLEARQATARAEAAEARMKALEEALRSIRFEAERENGRWVHLKRCIAVQSAQALGAEHGK